MTKVNRQANDWTVELLRIQSTDHVLEVGFGPGMGIKKAAAIAFLASDDASFITGQVINCSGGQS